MKRIITVLSVLTVLLCSCSNNEVSIMDNSNEVSIIEGTSDIPDDYFFPVIELKKEYEKGIVYDTSKPFNIKDYVDLKSYHNKHAVYFILLNEAKTSFKTEGSHNIEIYIRDDYGNENSISSVLVSGSDDEKDNDRKGHYEIRKIKDAYDETVAAYDEERMIKAPWIEKILIREAYSEEIEYCKEYGQDTYFAYICTGCGYIGKTNEEIYAHIEVDFDDACGSFSGQNLPYGEAYCLLHDFYTKYHEAEYDYIYHDAEYETIHHPESTIHHNEQYEKVWIDD